MGKERRIRWVDEGMDRLIELFGHARLPAVAKQCR